MEPRIQYAKTEDGVNIALSTLGEGTPLVHMPPIFSHLQLDWETPQFRGWYERLAEKRILVRYDIRGTGLSDRAATAFSLEAGVRDLEAVVGRLGLKQFALFAPVTSGPASIAYAARHPALVSHLVLCNAGAPTKDLVGGPQGRRCSNWRMLIGKCSPKPLRMSGLDGRKGRRRAAMPRSSGRA